MQTDKTALHGIRVLDLSRVLAGPFCTQILGDLGADIIKVERPRQGDDTRAWGPPFTPNGAAAYFTSANRNKRSITVDLKTEEGREIVRRAASNSDILIENYKTGELGSLGLGYESLREINPRLIYCSITGFGQTGPRAQQAGYDFLIQAMGGLISITGENERDGVKVGVAVADLFTGLWATVAILAALQSRSQSGLGQYIDLALFDCQLAMLANVAANWFASKTRPHRHGNAHPNIVPYQIFQAEDGPFALAVGNDRQHQSLCAAIGQPQLSSDPRFQKNADRVRNRAECIEALQTIFNDMKRAEIIERCDRAGVPAGLINGVDEAFSDPQAIERGMKIEMKDRNGDDIAMIGSPIKMSATPIEYRFAPPALGEHTYEILEELGYTEQERVMLREKGICHREHRDHREK